MPQLHELANRERFKRKTEENQKPTIPTQEAGKHNKKNNSSFAKKEYRPWDLEPKS